MRTLFAALAIENVNKHEHSSGWVYGSEKVSAIELIQLCLETYC